MTTRREAIAQLAALSALPLARWPVVAPDNSISPRAGYEFAPADPLDGTIADYQAGRARGTWTARDVSTHALERCRTDGAHWRASDALADTAVGEARASDARLRAGGLRGPLDGVPV